MGPELVAAIIGPLAGATIGLTGFLTRRNIAVIDLQLQSIASSVEEIHAEVTNLKISSTEKFATKEDLMRHSSSEERMNTVITNQLRELRDEVIVLRATSSYRPRQ